jgi:hypothetical protein
MDTAFDAWLMLRACNYQHLLVPGGLLAQPDEMMRDVSTIEWLCGVIEEQMRPDGNRGPNS